MDDGSLPDGGSPSIRSEGNGTIGMMSESSQKIRDSSIRKIKETWKVEELRDAFPAGIKPADLGLTALANIKFIAKRIPNLAEAQALFVNECKDSKGDPVPVGYSHTDRIMKAIKENEPSTPQAKATLTTGDDGAAVKIPSSLKSNKTTDATQPTEAEVPRKSVSKPAPRMNSLSKPPTKSVSAVPNLIVPGAGNNAPFSIGNRQMNKAADDMTAIKIGTYNKSNLSTSSAAEDMNSTLLTSKSVGSSVSNTQTGTKVTKEMGPLGSAPTGFVIPKKRRLLAKKSDEAEQNEPAPKKMKLNEKENETPTFGAVFPKKVQFEKMESGTKSGETGRLNSRVPFAKMASDDIQGVHKPEKMNKPLNPRVKVAKVVDEYLQAINQSQKTAASSALHSQMVSTETSQVANCVDFASLFGSPPETVAPAPTLHSESLYDTIDREIAKIMAHNKRENEKMFGSQSKLPFASQKDFQGHDIGEDTIIVDHRLSSSQGAQSEIPLLAPKNLQMKRPRSQSPLKSSQLKSSPDKPKTSSANGQTAKNKIAESTTSSGLGVNDNLKDWASKLPATLRDLCGHGGLDLARPDQLDQVNELKNIFNNTIDRMAIDIKFVFDKAEFHRHHRGQ